MDRSRLAASSTSYNDTAGLFQQSPLGVIPGNVRHRDRRMKWKSFSRSIASSDKSRARPTPQQNGQRGKNGKIKIIPVTWPTIFTKATQPRPSLPRGSIASASHSRSFRWLVLLFSSSPQGKNKQQLWEKIFQTTQALSKFLANNRPFPKQPSVFRTEKRGKRTLEK